MDNVYFCQFSNFVGNNIYLPYSVGSIISYLKTNETINKKYNIEILFLKQDPIRELKKPKFLFISVYMGNFKYSMDFAKAVKEKFKKCKIIIGGHHVPYFDQDFFKKYKFVDILVHGEGEKVCEEILLNTCYYNVHNLSINKLDNVIHTKKLYNNCSLDMIPSVYLSGVFDKLMKLPYSYTASLETNRGCPYACKYCDWGSNMTSQKKLRQFSKNKVFKEIEWIGQHKIDFVFGTDSNFGIFKRDMEFIDKIIEVKKEYGYPNKFRVCYAKNSDEVIFEMNRKLNEYNLSKGATLSFQSLNQKTQKAVGRKNMDLIKFKELIKKYKDKNIATYTEMILGLPEETYDSFANGLCKLIELGQHDSIVVYYCQIYPNSEINTPNFRKEFGLKTIKIPMYPTHTKIIDKRNVDEEEIIYETNTMPYRKWLKTCTFSWGIQTFHCLGLLRYIAIYLNDNNIISYKDFYERVLEFATKYNRTFIGKEYVYILNKYDSILDGNGFEYILPQYGDLNWTFEEGSFLRYILNLEDFYNNILSCLKGLLEFEELNALINFNRFMLKVPFRTYLLRNIKSIQKIMKYFGYKGSFDCDYFNIDGDNYENLENYATNVIWYGRKGGEFLHNLEEIKNKVIKNEYCKI